MGYEFLSLPPYSPNGSLTDYYTFRQLDKFEAEQNTLQTTKSDKIFCDGSFRVPAANPLGKSMGYHSRSFTMNSSEEETVIFKLYLLYIKSQGSSKHEEKREKESLESIEVATNQNSEITPLWLVSKRYNNSFIYTEGRLELSSTFNNTYSGCTIDSPTVHIRSRGLCWRKTLVIHFHNLPLIVDPTLEVFAMLEKGRNRLVPGPDYMEDALKLSNQVPRISSGVTTYVCDLPLCVCVCPDGTQHRFCFSILAVSVKSLASNGPIVDSRHLNLVLRPNEVPHNKLFLSSPTKYRVEPSWMLVRVWSPFKLLHRPLTPIVFPKYCRM
ncbi:hypothetical protein TNCV_512001 [Trichonephila clavipes]|nr:hypothetical protein TNCV_512001 [Trichonephila clavipes]